MPITSTLIAKTQQKLLQPQTVPLQAVIGFDGFVDEICDVVDKRASGDSYSRIETIKEYGDRISRAGGLSTNLELVPKVVKLGGNGPIMVNALNAQGVSITYIGALGDPTLHPVFTELASQVQAYSIAEPAHTDALEFKDGKIMMGKLESLKNITWERLIARVPVATLRELCRHTQLIASLNWTMLPYLTELWQHFIQEVLATITFAVPPFIFFDIADPEKRTATEISTALQTIQEFNKYGRAILGLNRKEATVIAQVLGLQIERPEQAALKQITCTIAQALSIYGVVVHPSDKAACFVAGEYYEIEGPYTTQPKLTTGAGDNFNAGFCYGGLRGCSPEESLVIGCGVSGFYVRHGHSPSQAELTEFLDTWAKHIGEEF
jgi:sugar/nucleoside kinase (ribokinase family)